MQQEPDREGHEERPHRAQSEKPKEKDDLSWLAGPIFPHRNTWADWGLAADQGDRFYAAAAEFHRAAPWERVVGTRAFLVTMPHGHWWRVYFSSFGGGDGGLTLDPRGEDGLVVLTYGPIDDIAPRVRQEIDNAGWEVAGLTAYPTIEFHEPSTVDVRQRQAEDVIALLGALPRFVAAHEELLGAQDAAQEPYRTERIRWRDDPSGIVIAEGPSRPILPSDDDVWRTHELAPSEPEGPGARPGARITKVSDARMTVAIQAGLSGMLVQKFTAYVPGDPASSKFAGVADRFAALVYPFLSFLTRTQQIPARAVNEVDLRKFLFQWIPANTESWELAKATFISLGRFFEFLDAEMGVRCPWASAILSDHDEFEFHFETYHKLSEEDAEEWNEDQDYELVLRVLLPPLDAKGGMEWSDQAGVIEASLLHDLQRSWLAWRDELIRSGITDRDAVFKALMERQRTWAKTPHPLARGEIPTYAIAREQEKMRRPKSGKPR